MLSKEKSWRNGMEASNLDGSKVKPQIWVPGQAKAGLKQKMAFLEQLETCALQHEAVVVAELIKFKRRARYR